MEPQTKVERRGIRRGIYVLPSLFTVGTLLCGYYAILTALRASQFVATGNNGGFLFGLPESLGMMNALDNAAIAIGVAIVFDGFDGRIARLTNTASAFGREFDSLADVIAFGVAPAVLAYVWGVRGVANLAGAPAFERLRDAGWVLTFVYVICGAARLARFNIDTVKPSGDRRFFVGMPIPAAAGFVAAVVHYYKQPLSIWQAAAVWLAIMGFLGFLMVSRMRYYSFKSIDLRKRHSYLVIILLGLIPVGIWYSSGPVLLAVAVTYAISGIVLRLTSRIRPRPSAPEEVHAA